MKIDRRPLQERLDEAERVQARSVALAQPHRRGWDERAVSDLFGRVGAAALSEPFGRFCLQHRLGRHCWLAGGQFEQVVRRARAAQGLWVLGLAPGDPDADNFCDGECALTRCAEAGDGCKKARRQLALMKLRRAKEVLIAVAPLAPIVLERLVYDKLEPYQRNTDIIIHSCQALAKKWGFTPRRAFGD